MYIMTVCSKKFSEIYYNLCYCLKPCGSGWKSWLNREWVVVGWYSVGDSIHYHRVGSWESLSQQELEPCTYNSHLIKKFVSPKEVS